MLVVAQHAVVLDALQEPQGPGDALVGPPAALLVLVYYMMYCMM